jgi:AraC-like DNA-binding protein
MRRELAVGPQALDVRYADSVDHPVFGFSLEAAGGSVGTHSHHKAQLFYAIAGDIVIESDAGCWMLPPLSAAWIPSGTAHASHYASTVKVGFLYIEPRLAPALNAICRPIFVNPLLRELLARIFFEGAALTPEEPKHVRLLSVLLDELASVDEALAALPIPRDPRLLRLVNALMKDPASKLTVDAWGARFGLSQRTLSRTFRREVGMSFAQWREQLQVNLAVQQLEAGQAVTRVAFALGYESPGAFIAMFKRNTGMTPGSLSAKAKNTSPARAQRING